MKEAAPIEKSQFEQISNILTPFIVLSIGGFLLQQAYFAISILRQKVFAMLYASFSLHSHDNFYKTLMDFLVEKKYIEASMTHVKVQKKKGKHDWMWWYNTDAKRSKKSIEFEFVPSPGNHVFKYKGVSMWVD